MQGRLENQRKIESKIKNKLQNAPEYMTKFYLSMQEKESRTCEEYLGYVNNFLKFINRQGKSVKENKLYNISSDDINLYMQEIRYTKKNNVVTSTSGSHRATVWSALNLFFNFLKTRRIIEDNPCSYTSRPRVKDRPEKVSLDPEEINVFIDNVVQGVGSIKAKNRQENWKSRDLLIALLFLTTGMRITTLSEINTKDLNQTTNKLTVVAKRGIIHEYYLDSSVIDCWNTWLRDREKLLGNVKCNALFISNRRQRMTTKAISNLIEKYTFNINKNITPHKIRSTYATAIYEATGDIYKTQQALGHSSPITTQRYINTDDKYQIEATKIMTDIIYQ